MSKLRVRQDASGRWVVTGHHSKTTGYGMTQREAWADMTASFWMGKASDRLHKLNQAESQADQLKRRNITLIAALIAQFVVIVATGAIMWIGG